MVGLGHGRHNHYKSERMLFQADLVGFSYGFGWSVCRRIGYRSRLQLLMSDAPRCAFAGTTRRVRTPRPALCGRWAVDLQEVGEAESRLSSSRTHRIHYGVSRPGPSNGQEKKASPSSISPLLLASSHHRPPTYPRSPFPNSVWSPLGPISSSWNGPRAGRSGPRMES